MKNRIRSGHKPKWIYREQHFSVIVSLKNILSTKKLDKQNTHKMMKVLGSLLPSLQPNVNRVQTATPVLRKHYLKKAYKSELFLKGNVCQIIIQIGESMIWLKKFSKKTLSPHCIEKKTPLLYLRWRYMNAIRWQSYRWFPFTKILFSSLLPRTTWETIWREFTLRILTLTSDLHLNMYRMRSNNSILALNN